MCDILYIKRKITVDCTIEILCTGNRRINMKQNTLLISFTILIFLLVFLLGFSLVFSLAVFSTAGSETDASVVVIKADPSDIKDFPPENTEWKTEIIETVIMTEEDQSDNVSEKVMIIMTKNESALHPSLYERGFVFFTDTVSSFARILCRILISPAF